MKIQIFIFVLCVLAFSCNLRRGEDAHSEKFPLEVSETVPYLVPADSIAPPIIIKAGKPEIVEAGIPVVNHSHQNIIKALKPIIKEAGVPELTIPGVEPLEQVVVSVAEPKVMPARIPDFFPAQKPYSRETNPYSFSFYTRLHGLQHDDISSLTQDARGNLWMGTYGGGVIRYDGTYFSQFTETEGLVHNYVLSVFYDSKGNLWFGTRGDGVTVYNGKEVKNYSIENGLSDNRIEEIFEDSRGRIWLGTYNGVSCIDGERIIQYTTQQGLFAQIVYAIVEDNAGNMWFGTRGGGISMFNGEKFFRYSIGQGLLHDYIVEATKDHNGDLWFGTDGGGIFRFDGKNFYHYTMQQGLPDNYITYVNADRNGKIWIGMRSKGMCTFDGEVFTHFSERQGLINNFVTSIVEDRSGKIWFGSYGGGLGQYNGHLFTHFTATEGLNNSFIRSITQDRSGNMWFGSDAGGVYVYDGKTFANYSEQQGLGYKRVGGVIEDHEGNIWMATTGNGLVKFDGKHFFRYTRKQGVPEEFLLSMFQDSKGNYWMTTRNEGLAMFDGISFYQYSTRQGISDNGTRCVMEDSYGRIWLGTRKGGISRLDNGKIVHLTEEGGMLSNNILDMMQDSRGLIWIATNGSGVSMFDGKRFVNLSEKDGLINNFVYSVLEDRRGNIWFGTRMGLARLLEIPDSEKPQPANSKPKVWFKNYTYDEGFIGIGCNSRTIYESRDGIIWVGANDVLTAVHPEGDISDTIPPAVEIIGLGLFNENVNWETLSFDNGREFTLANGVKIHSLSFKGLSDWYGMPENLKLPYDNNFLTFTYVGVASNFEKKVRYQYMLEGLDENWSLLTQRTEISYANLGPGKYNFKVRAVNADGYWSPETNFEFVIMFPLWLRWWAFVVYVISVSVLVAAVMYYYRKRKHLRFLEQQKEMQMQQEIELARKSAEFKQSFLANMSHEIRTPLTGILGMAEMLLKTDIDARQKDYLNTLIQAGETLRETINMVLDFSKIEAGKVALKENPFSIYDVFEKAEKLFASICNKSINLVMDIDPEIPQHVFADEQRLSQIVNNLLSNAVKFTSQGSITLKAGKDGVCFKDGRIDAFFVKVEVIDTGLGISEEDQRRLFNPFYQVDQSYGRKYDGTGLGLVICKELVKLLGGEIGVESKTGVGSNFWFTFRTYEVNDTVEMSELISKDTIPEAKSLHVLLVEDKSVNQKVIGLLLESLGHKVSVASNGEEALRVFRPEVFDIILMDIQMPVMDGITATRALKEKYAKLPPIVGLSANAFEGDREKYMAQGLDEYITKPVKSEDFEFMIHKLGLLK